MIKVAYIDEEPQFQRSFIRKARQHVDATPITPKPNIQDTIDELVEGEYDAIVCDYNLTQNNREVSYFGSDVITQIRNRWAKYPCFLLTAFGNAAADNYEDVNIVYPKNILNRDDENELSLFDIIIKQVQHYQQKIEHAYSRHNELIEKLSETRLTPSEEVELATVDSLIENTLYQPAAIPAQIKKSSELNTFKSLLDEAKEVIKASQEKRKS